MWLEARNIWFSYERGRPVLRGATLRLERGVYALVGETGSGKTTLLLILAGLLKPDEGEVLVGGERLDGEKPEHRRLIGVAFQDPDAQLFNPTVYDEIAYALRTLGLSEAEVREKVEAVAERLGIRGLLDRPPYELSMGQRRLVALASVLVYEPRFLLLDEPLTFLDPGTAARVACVIREWGGEGAVLIATHNVEAALLLADRLLVLRGGVVEEAGAGDVLRLYGDALASTNPALYALASRGSLEALLEARGVLGRLCGGDAGR